MQKEILNIDKLQDPQHPVTAIIGGSKVPSKIEILQNLLDKVDNMIIDGGMAFTFAKQRAEKLVLPFVKMTRCL